jgi:hypothetical protein
MTKQMRPGEIGADRAGEDRTPPIEWSQIIRKHLPPYYQDIKGA